jgi:putative peptidoglycan lipid II flippase
LRVFYAMRDGRTPTLINIYMVATKVALVLISNAVFRATPGTDVNVHPSVHAVEWLNISTSLSYVVGAVVGQVLLSRRLGRLGSRSVAVTTLRIGLASALGGASAYAVVVWMRHLFGHAHAGAVSGLVLGAVAGLAVMAAVAWRMRIPEVRDVLALARGR